MMNVLATASVNQPLNMVSIIAVAVNGMLEDPCGMPICMAPLPAPAMIFCLTASGMPWTAWIPSVMFAVTPFCSTAHGFRAGLAVLCLGLFMILLDGMIVNIAIPDIQTYFKTSFSNIEWVMNAYILASAVLLVTLGRFVELWGRRKLFVAGMVLFTLGSLACGLAPSIYLLIACSTCLLYTSPSPRDGLLSRMPSSA